MRIYKYHSYIDYYYVEITCLWTLESLLYYLFILTSLTRLISGGGECRLGMI